MKIELKMNGQEGENRISVNGTIDEDMARRIINLLILSDVQLGNKPQIEVTESKGQGSGDA